jgi:hypothetical protein
MDFLKDFPFCNILYTTYIGILQPFLPWQGTKYSLTSLKLILKYSEVETTHTLSRSDGYQIVMDNEEQILPNINAKIKKMLTFPSVHYKKDKTCQQHMKQRDNFCEHFLMTWDFSRNFATILTKIFVLAKIIVICAREEQVRKVACKNLMLLQKIIYFCANFHRNGKSLFIEYTDFTFSRKL